MKIKSIEDFHGEQLITMEDGRKFLGGGTVWFIFPEGKRVGTKGERNIGDALKAYDIQQKLNMENT